jgi:outer membrane protein assembly factor BamB
MPRILQGVLLFGGLAVGGAAAFVAPPGGFGADWPQWLGEDREGVWRETGLLERFPAGGPKILWRAPLGPGNSGPAVARGRVYVMDRQPALGGDGKPASAKTGLSPGKERVVCLAAADGRPVWEYSYDCLYSIAYRSGPRVTPLVHKGRVYTLGAMGDLYCLDAAAGRARWHKNLAKAYNTAPPLWGWAASPLVDGDLLYCLTGGEGSAIVAFNKDTGEEVWKTLTTEEVGYSPPILIEAGGKRQLIVWHSESINGLDPATGRVYWSQPYPTEGEPERPAPTIAQVRRSGNLLFLASYYHGPLMLKLAPDRPAVTVLWKDKTKKRTRPIGLHCLMSTPVIKDGYIYGVCANGELRCCDAKSGDQLWETYAAVGGRKTDCGTAFLVPQGGRFVLFNDSGELILANLTPKGYAEIDRARIVEPAESSRGRQVVWAHPAFANRCVFARNNKEIVCVSLVASGAAAGGGKPPAAPPRPPAVEPKPVDLDAKSVEIIKQAAALYKNVRSMHADAQLETTVKEGNEERKAVIAVRVDLERPNHFALRSGHAADRDAGLELVCDGKSLYAHARRLKQYTESKAPVDLAGVGRALARFGHPATGMLFQNVLAEDPADVLLDSVTSCAYAGREAVGEAKADHVKLRQPDLEWEVWVAAEGKPFVLKVVTRAAGEGVKVVTVETYRNWKVDHKPDDAAFRFVPPADAKSVKAFKRPAPRAG